MSFTRQLRCQSLPLSHSRHSILGVSDILCDDCYAIPSFFSNPESCISEKNAYGGLRFFPSSLDHVYASHMVNVSYDRSTIFTIQLVSSGINIRKSKNELDNDHSSKAATDIIVEENRYVSDQIPYKILHLESIGCSSVLTVMNEAEICQLDISNLEIVRKKYISNNVAIVATCLDVACGGYISFSGFSDGTISMYDWRSSSNKPVWSSFSSSNAVLLTPSQVSRRHTRRGIPRHVRPSHLSSFSNVNCLPSVLSCAALPHNPNRILVGFGDDLGTMVLYDLRLSISSFSYSSPHRKISNLLHDRNSLSFQNSSFSPTRGAVCAIQHSLLGNPQIAWIDVHGTVGIASTLSLEHWFFNRSIKPSLEFSYPWRYFKSDNDHKFSLNPSLTKLNLRFACGGRLIVSGSLQKGYIRAQSTGFDTFRSFSSDEKLKEAITEFDDSIETNNQTLSQMNSSITGSGKHSSVSMIQFSLLNNYCKNRSFPYIDVFEENLLMFSSIDGSLAFVEC